MAFWLEATQPWDAVLEAAFAEEAVSVVAWVWEEALCVEAETLGAPSGAACEAVDLAAVHCEALESEVVESEVVESEAVESEENWAEGISAGPGWIAGSAQEEAWVGSLGRVAESDSAARTSAGELPAEAPVKSGSGVRTLAGGPLAEAPPAGSALVQAHRGWAVK